MNAKAVIPLVLAVVLGLVAALMVKNVIAHRAASNAPEGNLVTAIVAKENVEPGKQLTKEELGTSKIPAEAAAGQIFSDPNQLIGRVAITPLVKGQTILANFLAPAGAAGGLQALIPAGMRAMTLEVTEYSGVGGMLQPGCHIDVMTLLHDEKTGAPVTRTILQNIKIVAVGHNTSNMPPADGQAPPPSNAVTLLCTPRQTQILNLAMMAAGRPWFVLRSTADGQELPVEGTTLAQLRGDDDSQQDAVAVLPTITPAVTTGGSDMPTVTKRVVEIIRAGVPTDYSYTVATVPGTTADLNTSEVAPH